MPVPSGDADLQSNERELNVAPRGMLAGQHLTGTPGRYQRAGLTHPQRRDFAERLRREVSRHHVESYLVLEYVLGSAQTDALIDGPQLDLQLEARLAIGQQGDRAIRLPIRLRPHGPFRHDLREARLERHDQ